MIQSPLNIIIIPIIMISAIVVIIGGYTREARYWPEWFLLIVPQDADEASVIKEFHSFGIEDLLASSKVEIHYMAIPEMSTMNVDQIDEQLPIGDPRRDPFIQNVDKLFKSGENTFIYLPADRGIMSYRRILRRSPVFDGLRILDDMQTERFVALALFILAIVGVTILFPGQPFSMLIAALPWMPLAFIGGFSFVYYIIALFVLSACRYLDGWPATVIALIGSLIVFFFAWRDWALRNFVLFITAEVGSETIFFILRNKTWKTRSLGYLHWLLGREERRDHKPFEPLSLTGRRPQVAKAIPWIGVVKSCVAIGLVMACSLIRNGPHDLVPAVTESVGSYDSVTAFHKLMMLDRRDNPPHVSELLSSFAFQKGFLNGAQYEFPLPGTELTLNRYVPNGDAINKVEVVVAAYDSQWYKYAVRKILGRGVGRLFAPLDGPSQVIYTMQPIHAGVLKGPTLLQLVLTSLILLAALLIGNISARRSDRAEQSSLLLYKKGDAA